VVYGPLCNGITTLMFESTPLYPDASRYWAVVERHRITQFFTAPTAIRALMRFGDAPVKKHDLRSLRIIGSAGEPLNPEAWKWFERVVGAGRTAVVDAYWQVSARACARARTRACVHARALHPRRASHTHRP
jgi:acetyl-CoA synthetase